MSLSDASDQISKTIDLAVLQPTATFDEVLKAAELVEDNKLASICVAPCNIMVAGSRTTRVCSVIGFPHGNTSSLIKYLEAKRAIECGVCELDVVVNYGHFLDGDKWIIKSDLANIVTLAHQHNVKVKAILETCFYSQMQIHNACLECVKIGVDWVKTSTGFAGGATPEAVSIMLEAVNGNIGVKASGGIKTRKQALQYLNMGCTRLGVSQWPL